MPIWKYRYFILRERYAWMFLYNFSSIVNIVISLTLHAYKSLDLQFDTNLVLHKISNPKVGTTSAYIDKLFFLPAKTGKNIPYKSWYLSLYLHISLSKKTIKFSIKFFYILRFYPVSNGKFLWFFLETNFVFK